MRRLIFAIVILATLFAPWPLAAQEQSASIQGIVKDSQGGVLPGVTVEARNAQGGVVTTYTDARGAYRFPSLLPGQVRHHGHAEQLQDRQGGRGGPAARPD